MEALKYHPHLRAHLVQVAGAVEHAPGPRPIANELVEEIDFALVVLLEKIQAAQHRALARATRPDDDQNLALPNLQIDAT